MPQLGTVQRQKPRIRVYRGYDPMNPSKLSRTAPVKDGVTIQSGQAIGLEWDATSASYQWALWLPALGIPYIAYGESTDPDVRDAEALKGLSPLDTYDLHTAHFDAVPASTLPYNEGQAVGPSEDVPGNWTTIVADSGAPIVGYCGAGMRGPIDIAGEDSSAVITDVVRFVTRYERNPEIA